MELDKFAQLIACNSTNIAKNTLSYLIGNGQVNSDWDEALSNLYKSFPKELKETVKQKKEFLPVISKFFKTYEISNHNIDIFNEYAELISSKEKDYIKSKNKNWVWEKEPEVVFKNPFAFTRAIGSKNVFEFTEKYKDQFESFLEKQKSKIYQNFDSHNIWILMMKTDYSKFVSFCEKYDFNHLDILRDNFNEYTHIDYLNVLNEKNIDLFLKNLNEIGKDVLKEKMPHLFPEYIESRSGNKNSFYVLLDTISKGEYEAAIKFMTFFDKELTEYVNKVNYKINAKDNKKLDLSTSENFKETLLRFTEYYKDYTSSYTAQSMIVKLTLDNKLWFNFLDKYELNKDLKNSLVINNTEPKRKNKI